MPALWAGLAVTCGVLAAGRIPDDMFISFRYAWNLAHGEGFVFNPGERVFGLTNPGHALGLALLHGIATVPIHVLAAVVFAGSLWGLAVLVYREGRRRGATAEAVLGGTLVLASSYVWLSIGSASASVLALLAGSAVLVHRRPATSGVLAALAAWYRPDAVLGVAALGVLAWIEGRRPPWRWGLVAGAVLGAGLLGAWLWFDSFLPNTLEAKRVMAEARGAAFGQPESFWGRAVPILRRHLGDGWLVWTALGVAGQWPLFARGGTALRTLLLYGAGVALAYPLLGVPYFVWYTIPPVVCLLFGLAGVAVGAGRGLAAAVRATQDRPGLARAAGTTLAVLVLAGPALDVTGRSIAGFQRFNVPNRYDSFREAGLWIREHSLPEARIAYGEIGQLAYWSQRPVDDLMGLVTPEMLPYVAAGDRVNSFLVRPPEFFLHHPANSHPGIVSRPWFREGYYPVARIEDLAGRDLPTVVYRKRPDAEFPPPRPPRERKGPARQAPKG